MPWFVEKTRLEQNLNHYTGDRDENIHLVES